MNPVLLAQFGQKAKDSLKLRDIQNSTNIQLPEEKQDNTTMYTIIGAIVVLFVIVFFVMRKK